MSRRNSIIKMEFDHIRYEPNISVSGYLTYFSFILTPKAPDIKDVVGPALGPPE